MRRAGYAVAQFCASQFKFSSVLVVCGRGKNGGAGLMAAEALHRIAETVSVIILAKRADELRPEIAACLSAGMDPLWIADEADFANAAAQEALGADLIIDAMIGTGFKPPLSGVVAAAVAAVNDAPGTIVSVDLPTGVEADGKTPLQATGGNVVFPHGIIALIAPKPVHVYRHLTAGPIAVSELGVQPAFVPSAAGIDVITGREVGMALAPLPAPGERAERPFGGFGHVLVVAGSSGREGTAALVGMAALTAGAGRVTIACPRSIQPTVASFHATLATQALPETDQGTIAAGTSDQIRALLAGKDAVVIGPGLSRNPATGAFVRRLASMCALPLIVDGDGLDAFDGRFAELKRREETPFLVLIPYAEQAARLTGFSVEDIRADNVKAARRIANATGVCVVLKSGRRVVAGACDEVWINASGNPVLAKAGIDELLSGIIGAALARHVAPGTGAANQEPAAARTFERVLLNDVRVAAAVHLHGLAADIARDALHENVVGAMDVLEALLEAFRECDLQVEQNLFYLHK